MPEANNQNSSRSMAGVRLGHMVAIGLIAVLILWALYSARPKPEVLPDVVVNDPLGCVLEGDDMRSLETQLRALEAQANGASNSGANDANPDTTQQKDNRCNNDKK